MQADDGVARPVHGGGRDAANGVSRCPACGSSEVEFDGAWLTCPYCHRRWNTAVLADELHLSEGIDTLVGTSVLTGAHDIDGSVLVTVECDGCGASVTLNTESTLSGVCHWCRHTLSVNNAVDNGAVPDAILPFYVTREQAAAKMAEYVADQGEFATQDFLTAFSNATLCAVYLPYLVVDANVTVRVEGRGWTFGPDHQPGWHVVVGEGTVPTRAGEFATEEFAIMREADLLVDDLAIEARSTRSKLFAAVSTTNIINAIQPFDVEHAMRFDANYLTDGVAFERRDLEVADAIGEAASLCATLTRGYVNQTLTQYLGGVRWESEAVAIKGSRWISVLLPVWLYGYEETTPAGAMMHYLAVNGRTGETEGSIPVDVARAQHSGQRWGAVAATFLGPSAGTRVSAWRSDMLAQGQRKGAARLKPEFETRYTPTRLEQRDTSLGVFVHPGGPEIEGRNDTHPEARAALSTFVLGELPRAAGDETVAAGEGPMGSPATRLDTRVRTPAGQAPTAGPPGSAPPIQLIPGWRDS